MYCFMIFLKNVYPHDIYIIEISFQIENLFFNSSLRNSNRIFENNTNYELLMFKNIGFIFQRVFVFVDIVCIYLQLQKRYLGSNLMQNAFNSHLRTSNRIFKNNTCKNAFSRMIMTLQTIAKIKSNVYVKILFLYVIPGRCLFYCCKKSMQS